MALTETLGTKIKWSKWQQNKRKKMPKKEHHHNLNHIDMIVLYFSDKKAGFGFFNTVHTSCIQNMETFSGSYS